MNIDEIEKITSLIDKVKDSDVKKMLKDYLYNRLTLVCLPTNKINFNSKIDF